jgi:hypothetical protein
MAPLTFLLIVLGTAAALTVAAFLHLARGHVLHRAVGLSATFFAGALAGFLTAILLGVLGAMALGSDGSLGQAGALLFLCFIGAMCALTGSLCVMGMSRILKWKPAQRS